MNSKKFAVLVAAVAMLGVPATASAASQDRSGNDRQVVKLTDQNAADAVEENIEEAAAAGSRTAKRELADWDALSAAEQREVGAVVASEEFAIAVASGENDDTALAEISPDLAVRETSGTELGFDENDGVLLRKAYYNVTSWWRHTYTVLGVDITSVKSTYKYQTNASTVTASYSCLGTSTNWAPTRSLSVIDTSHWRSSGKGYCDVAWRITYAIAWIPTPFHNDFTQQMRVNGSSGIESTTFAD